MTDRPDDRPEPDLVRIGCITGFHGLRGGLRFKPDNPGTQALDNLEAVTIETEGVRHEHRLIAVSAAGHGAFKMQLEGVPDVNSAQALKGATVLIPAASLPATEPNEFYYFRAIGCAVFLTDGTLLGQVAEMFSNGANDVIVVREGKREILIPVIEDVVKAIDLEARRIVVEPVPGLLA